MACDRNGNRVSKLCAVRSGISTTGSKAAAIAGSTVAGLQRRMGRASGAVLAVANAIEGPKSVDNLLPLAVIGAIASDLQSRRPHPEAETEGRVRTGRPPNWRHRLLNGVALLKLVRAGSGSAATGLARLSKPRDEPVNQRNYFGGRVVIRAWNSRLSAAFNAQDILPGVTVKASAGRMYEHQGQAWHCGTTLVKTSAGERAVTHLQRMGWPASHYYFSRSLRDQEIAGILAGHREFEPKHLPGFAGEIGEVEALLPGMARLKRNLIKHYLLWGELGR